MSRFYEFQSTRPRGERRCPSIFTESSVSVSQSTRPRGERLRRSQPIRVRREFQSTRPRGERRAISPSILFSLSVSIHAPARGATFGRSVPRRLGDGFNPRARAGSDLQSPHLFDQPRRFQSTRPRGERLAPGIILQLSFRVSIHAPARGATIYGTDEAIKRIPFQSTRPRGERPSVSVEIRPVALCFNPRARAGSDVDGRAG